MYWLLDYVKQEQIRQVIVNLQMKLSEAHPRDQREQIFPFNGRKDKAIAKTLINSLSPPGGNVCDPFSGSGTFGYAAMELSRRTFINEWEPYAYRLSNAPYNGLPENEIYTSTLRDIISRLEPLMRQLYLTRCPNCSSEFMFDGLFFDRHPENFFTPTRHERMGTHGENIIFRGKYRCSVCRCSEKFFDDFDNNVLANLPHSDLPFPEAILIENSRLNFTSPLFTNYSNLFSPRQKKALMYLFDAVSSISDRSCKSFFMDTFLSFIHCAKYTDYRSKSQDNHCPDNRLKETNLYYRFLERLEMRKKYFEALNYDQSMLMAKSCMDFRDFLATMQGEIFDLVLTDPPYGDSVQYFEHAQRVHPFMGYNLSLDTERLNKEVVISNAPSRANKQGKNQFLGDIERLFVDASRVTKTHGYLTLYFRPEQSDWISDLNKLKHFGRMNGFEPLISVSLDNNDPSMRVLSSAAWAFSNDMCLIFLKLARTERRWYERGQDVDELVYLAALDASNSRGDRFVIENFNLRFRERLASVSLLHVLQPNNRERIETTLLRFCRKEDAQYILHGLSPYSLLNRDMQAELRLREFAPVVIEELSADGRGFTFENYVIRLSAYMENGSRKIIDDLHRANRLIPELLLNYAEEDATRGLFFPRVVVIDPSVTSQKISIRSMDPSDFEVLIADYFCRRGYVNATVIGRSCDRGVDVLATNPEGGLELIQCKRYREGNNIGSSPIQRVDSYMRSRMACKAWVITTSDFTPEGRDEARITGVITVNGANLIQSLEGYFPNRYRL